MTGGMVNFVMGELVKMTGLTNTDRFLGMIFGLARGGLVVLLVVAVLHHFAPVEDEAWYKQSRLVPEIIVVIEKLSPILWEQGEPLFRAVKRNRLLIKVPRRNYVWNCRGRWERRGKL